jgi:hypothetical protein
MECYITRHGRVYGHSEELSGGNVYLHMDGVPWSMSDTMAEAVVRTFVNKGLKKGLKYLTRTYRGCQGHDIRFQKYIP